MYALSFCLPEGTLNITTMAYVWNQTPHSTDFKKTCSTWPSDSNLFSRNRGTTGNRHAARFWDRYCCSSRDWGKEFDFRFKPVQKFDACSGENYSGGGQPHPGAAEQTVIAQSQHHQQFLGQLLFSLHKPQNTWDEPKHTYECFHIVFPPLWFYCCCLYSPTDASRALPDFVELDLGQNNAENIALEDVKALQSLYREHCEVRWSPLCWFALQSFWHLIAGTGGGQVYVQCSIELNNPFWILKCSLMQHHQYNYVGIVTVHSSIDLPAFHRPLNVFY